MKVVVTRPRDRAAELVARLETLGHEVVVCPLVETEPLGDEPVDVDGYDWVIVTSRTWAEELRRRMRGQPQRVAAIGRATVEVLGGADLVPAVSTQEGLLEALPRPAGRVLFAGDAAMATDVMTGEGIGQALLTGRLAAEAIVAAGDADMVAMARAMLYDPRWAWHAAATLGGEVHAPEQYWRCPPREAGRVFGDTKLGQR